MDSSRMRLRAATHRAFRSRSDDTGSSIDLEASESSSDIVAFATPQEKRSELPCTPPTIAAGDLAGECCGDLSEGDGMRRDAARNRLRAAVR
mmetsp:Transcript_5011/g.10075  ORF Transcript_5011/g.10075 Transcript_5011/m.10075 type:complete len:92 (+) Transcript_5011:493-768(+)